ncbi:MAG: hypothetical protein IKQ39_07920 [Oscillospiraceae bacterium]|nr:hypothetical protein [Oscillospiraceae bacterium]
MASIYTDEVRQTRYMRLRRRKRILDRIFDVCMIAALVFGTLALYSAGPMLMEGLGGADIRLILGGLICILPLPGIIVTIYLKNWKAAAAEFALLFLAGAILIDGTYGLLIFIDVIALVTDIFWEKLSQQEGFPTFEIGYQEEKERAKALHQYAENRAVAAGVRAERTEPDNDMHDLLDADTDVGTVTQKLTGMHDRYRDVQTHETGRAAYVPGVMDDLETTVSGSDDSAGM